MTYQPTYTAISPSGRVTPLSHDDLSEVARDPLAADTTPAYVSDESRWLILSAQLDAALELARAYTDFPPTLEMVRQLRVRFNWMKNNATASHALGACGPNGMLPAIDKVMNEARYHGFNWRERAREGLS